MTEIGFITFAELGALARSGMSPEQAVDRLLAEAQARFPQALGLQINQEPGRGGFSITALRMDGQVRGVSGSERDGSSQQIGTVE